VIFSGYVIGEDNEVFGEVVISLFPFREIGSMRLLNTARVFPQPPFGCQYPASRK